MSDLEDARTLSAYAWARLVDRMAGLDQTELGWEPTSDPDLSLRWRLNHLVEVLADERNAAWLGVSTDPAGPGLLAAGEYWERCLTAVDPDTFGDPLGEVAGPYGGDTRRAFVLHVLDELIHHAAEAALLRDLYADR